MKKSDFKIPKGKLPTFLKSAEILRDNEGDCIKTPHICCNNCPFDSDYYKYADFGCGTGKDDDNGIKKAKRFIKLFGGRIK